MACKTPILLSTRGTTPLTAATRLCSRPARPGWGTPGPLLLALGGILEDVFHVINLAAEVFSLHVLLLLELGEHQLLLLQRLQHAGTVAVQTLLMKQELG